jgi:hypothetical protein
MSKFFNRLLENLRQGPLGPALRWLEAHPRLSAWLVLALGMNIIFVIAGRDVGLLPSQWVALLTASTLVAGACIWIISWEDEPSVEEDEAAPRAAAAQQVTAAQPSAPTAPEAAPKKRPRKPKTSKS